MVSFACLWCLADTPMSSCRPDWHLLFDAAIEQSTCEEGMRMSGKFKVVVGKGRTGAVVLM
ncbi:hypothetical protein, partial [Rhizobium leguminosarum]|uniref:hypothetical protein n=1 Tax=Rhizobium leguminosarum TaxID=384 RepID=UPI003F9E8A09